MGFLPTLLLHLHLHKKTKIVRAVRLSGCQYKVYKETVMDGRCALWDQFSTIVYCRIRHPPVKHFWKLSCFPSMRNQPINHLDMATPCTPNILPCNINPFSLHCMQCIYFRFCLGPTWPIPLSENQTHFANLIFSSQYLMRFSTRPKKPLTNVKLPVMTPEDKFCNIY